MKLPILLAAGLVAAGCASDEMRVDGTLAGEWAGDSLWVSAGDAAEPVAVRDGAFSLSAPPSGSLELRIGAAAGEGARLRIGRLGPGTRLSLDRLRLDARRGLAFPSSIRLDGVELIEINGLRMADRDAAPGEVEVSGTVLAASGSADALVLRPDAPDRPDYAVLIDSATRVTDPSGADARLGALSAGDPVHVGGRMDGPYLNAERIVLSRADRRDDEGDDDAPDPAPRRADAPATATARSRSIESDQDSDRGGGREGKGKGKGKGEGKGDRGEFQGPAGHRPPPGMCRDWNPDLPPGQQPPPRKC